MWRPLLVIVALLSQTAAADAAPDPDRVPLHDNFPWLEIIGIGGLVGANVVLKTYEYDLAAARVGRVKRTGTTTYELLDYTIP